MYKSKELSCYIVNKCIKDKRSITNLTLQKILYFLQWYFIKNFDRQLFPDDIEVWYFRPAIANPYYRYCGFGAMKIDFTLEESNIKFYNNDKNIIDSIVNKMSKKEYIKEFNDKNSAYYKAKSEGLDVIPISYLKEEDLQYEKK